MLSFFFAFCKFFIHLKYLESENLENECRKHSKGAYFVNREICNFKWSTRILAKGFIFDIEINKFLKISFGFKIHIILFELDVDMIAFGDICWGLRSAGSKINKYQKLPQFVSVPEVFTFVAWKCRFQGSKSEIFWVSKFSKISSNLAISKMKDFGNAFYFGNYWMSKCLATNYPSKISEDYML